MTDQANPALAPLLVDETEARRLLGGLCPKSMFNLRRYHGLPFVKLGNRVMYDPNDVADWIESRKQRNEVSTPHPGDSYSIPVP